MRQFAMITTILILTTLSVLAQKEDKKKSATNTPVAPAYVEGIAYSLPLTGIRFQVVAEREARVAGPYAQFAQKYLGIENITNAPAESWDIISTNIETFSEPDPNQVHKAMGLSAALINLTESGVIAGINSTVKTPEGCTPTGNFPTENINPEFPFTDLSMWGMFTKADTLKNGRVVAKSLEEKAAEAAETIYKLRDSRFRLLTNADDEPLPDGKAFDVMAKELGNLEKEYVSLFIGKTVKKTYKYNFDYIPGENGVKGDVVFRFSETRGILPKTDLSGKPIVVDVNKLEDLAGQQKRQVASENPTAGQSGIYYRMPGAASVVVLYGVGTLATTRATIAQFGTTASLPEDLLNGEYSIEYHPQTGAVKAISKMK